MTQVKQFKDFGITPSSKAFVGTKVEIDSILNNEITVYEFKISNSKFVKENTSGKCLHLQIGIGASKHVVFSGSLNLMEMIQQIPPIGFPFTTKIIKENKRLLFT
ncbi:MAG: hypothetical protein K8R85_05825 [Bacteroidetes bacterium]|nr:hypothetical protein [Bacteroidota bacterium]